MKFISILFLSSLTLAYPNGAPACVANEQRIMKMGGSNQNLGFAIKPSSNTFSPGQEMTFTVDGPKSYKGLLIYVSSTTNARVRVGNFKQLPTGFKSNKDKCDLQGYEAGPVGAVTHSNANPKQPGTKLKWVTSAKDKCETVEIHAVVAVDQKVWQILSVVKLSCNGGDGGDSPSKDYQGEEPSTDNNYGGDAPSKKKKCKKGKKPKDDYQDKEPANDDYAPMKPKKKCKKKKPSDDYQGEEPSSDDTYKGDDQGDEYTPTKPKKKCKKKPSDDYQGEEPSSDDTYKGDDQGDEYTPTKPKKKCKKKKPSDDYQGREPSSDDSYKGDEPSNDYVPEKPKKKCKKGKKPSDNDYSDNDEGDEQQ